MAELYLHSKEREQSKAVREWGIAGSPVRERERERERLRTRKGSTVGARRAIAESTWRMPVKQQNTHTQAGAACQREWKWHLQVLCVWGSPDAACVCVASREEQVEHVSKEKKMEAIIRR